MSAVRYNKYRNIPTERDGITFASKKEATHYQQLKLRQYAGEIGEIDLQPRYPLIVNGMLIGTYIADFRYPELPSGRVCVIDVKSAATRTPVYRLKKKLVHALYNVTIIEV